MIRHDFMTSLQNEGIHNQAEYQKNAFARNIGLYTEIEQDRLSRATVAIPGMGGVGGGAPDDHGSHWGWPLPFS